MGKRLVSSEVNHSGIEGPVKVPDKLQPAEARVDGQADQCPSIHSFLQTKRIVISPEAAKPRSGETCISRVRASKPGAHVPVSGHGTPKSALDMHHPTRGVPAPTRLSHP
jgi:hypothetical protein